MGISSVKMGSFYAIERVDKNEYAKEKSPGPTKEDRGSRMSSISEA